MHEVCPACGCTTLTEEEKDFTIHEPFAGDRTISITNYRCETCGFSGDLSGCNDVMKKDALAELQKAAMHNILNYFGEHDYSFAGIERALGLPQRTLTKWKSGVSSPTKSAIALFKLLRLFPWLIDVADHDFDSIESQKICMKHSIEQFIDCLPDDRFQG